MQFSKHGLHHHPLPKFFLVLLILLAYTLFTTYKFGIQKGVFVSVLTWSFFVLCTPIADAGLLLDFPIRLVTGIRMLFSEAIVWIIAISLNATLPFLKPSIYSSTLLLSLLHHIITHPFPFWAIIFLSAIGTFLSIIFGDEILDIAFEKKDRRNIYFKHFFKYKLLIFVFLFVLVLLLYNFLLSNIGIDVPLI